jgi:hypothetical protein
MKGHMKNHNADGNIILRQQSVVAELEGFCGYSEEIRVLFSKLG